MKKKWLAFMMAAVMIVGVALTGCSGGEANQAASSEAAPSTENAGTSTNDVIRPSKDPYKDDIKIGFVTAMIAHSVPVAWSTGIERELQYYPNVKYQAFDGQNSAETQVQLMQDLINQEYDCIILQACDAAALAPSVEDAEKAGIPVINLNLDADTPHTALISMVDYEAGQIVAQQIGEALNGKGNVVIIQSPPGASLGVAREMGFRDYVAGHYPDLKIVGEQNGEWLKENAMTIMNSFMQTNSQIDAVYAINDSMAEGAALAAEAAGRLDEMLIWGADGEKDALAMIEQGRLTGTVYTNCYQQGETAARLALYVISAGICGAPNGETPLVKMAPIPVTSENVSQIQPADRW